MMRTIRPPESKQATTLMVAVRCRPLTGLERNKNREIIRVVDNKVVVVLDPDTSKDYLDRVHNRSKEKRYAYDCAFGPESTNQDVYNTTVSSMVEGVIQGLNATIFAYGATGSGKTHTMAGTGEDPGLMVLCLKEIFNLVSKEESQHEFEVTCSYLEVYNEVIYDLLEKSSGHLELREDPDQGITVAGLKRIQVHSADKILELLNLGNSRRKTESTDANATSSRSHAVLEIIVKRKQRSQYRPHVWHGKLALVDLAGSERASETNNAGQKLRDGANINKSLLALANCINALGKQQKKGLAYVPYRNSKLTRILKDGLSGNSRTVMVATISPCDDQYQHILNTLKYADRAKEIKTHIQKNIGTMDSHVADYQRMIDNLQGEVCELRKELAEKESKLSERSTEKAQDDELSWLDVLSHDINENVEERINLQKALFELEDINLHNRIELQQLDELIAKHQMVEEDGKIVEALVERRQVILDNVRDNDEAGAYYRQEIEQNEALRKDLQQVIDEAIQSNGNKTYLRILSQYRLLGMTNTELQFQIAVRDQIINNQREALSNLWLLLESSGLDHKQIFELAARQGITIENWIVPPPVTNKAHTAGSPLLPKQKQVATCVKCTSPAHIPRLSDGTSMHCYSSLIGCCNSHKDMVISPKGLPVVSPRGLNSVSPRGRRKINYVARSPFHVIESVSAEAGSGDNRGLIGLANENQDNNFPSRMCRDNFCKFCTVAQKDINPCRLMPEVVYPSPLLGIRLNSPTRQRGNCFTNAHLQFCCSRDQNICVTCQNLVKANENMGTECCWNDSRQQHCYEYSEVISHLKVHLQNHENGNSPENNDKAYFRSCGHYEHDTQNQNTCDSLPYMYSSNNFSLPQNGGHCVNPSSSNNHTVYNSCSSHYQNQQCLSGIASGVQQVDNFNSLRCATHGYAASRQVVPGNHNAVSLQSKVASEWTLDYSPFHPSRPGFRES